MTNCRPQTKTNVRYMVGSDLSRCSELSTQYLPSQLKNMLCQRTVIGRVLEVGNLVVGFEIHAKHKWLVEILDLGFEHEFRAEVSWELIEQLQDKIRSGGSAKEIIAVVPEADLYKQLVLRDAGFTGSIMVGEPVMYKFRWKP